MSLAFQEIDFKLESYNLKMASFDENLDHAKRLVCLFLLGNGCKDLQECLRNLLSNWNILGLNSGDLLWTKYTLQCTGKSKLHLTMYAANLNSSRYCIV